MGRQFRGLGVRLFACAVIGWPLATTAFAQQRIGAVSVAENSVSALRTNAEVRLGRGDAVFRSEAVLTGQASSARLTFLDDTNLSIGPSSRVVLDEFVYRGGSQAQNVAVSLTRGAFRFATGNSDKNAYQIKTTTATIGVRGTVLDIFSGPTETLVTLMDDGAATICTSTRSRCSTLNIRGQTFVIDSAGVRLSNTPRTRFSFQQFCAGAAGLCGRTRLAQNPGEGTIPPQLPRQVAALRREEAQPGCNNGSCIPSEPSSEPKPYDGLPWTGVATGFVRTTANDYTLRTFGLTLATSTSLPIVNNASVTAAAREPGSGTITTTAHVDPGYSYTAWGEWNGSVTVTQGGTSNTLTRGLAVFGAITPSATVAGKTGSATYSGAVNGDFIPASGSAAPGAVSGTANITANFNTQKVSGSLALSVNATPWANATFGNIPIGSNSTVGNGAVYSGILGSSQPYSLGSINGAFLGPGAQETAGYFSFSKWGGSSTDGTATGIFRGRQGGAP